MDDVLDFLGVVLTESDASVGAVRDAIQDEYGDSVGHVQPEVAKALDIECEICPDQPGTATATVVDDEAITTEGGSLSFSDMSDPFADNFDVEPIAQDAAAVNAEAMRAFRRELGARAWAAQSAGE